MDISSYPARSTDGTPRKSFANQNKSMERGRAPTFAVCDMYPEVTGDMTKACDGHGANAKYENTVARE